MKIETVSRILMRVGIGISMLTIIAFFIRFGFERGIDSEWRHNEHWGELLDYIILGVTIVFLLTPEGLPLSIRCTLAYSIKRMV